MSREIITVNGKSREERVEIAKRIRHELETELPELAALRDALVAEGMMDPGIKAIRAIKTERIDYDVRRDNPRHDDLLYNQPVVFTEEMRHDRDEFQARKIREARAAESLSERGRSRNRRS